MEPWTITDGLSLVRGIQKKAREFGYHVCLGGGVLNTGMSKKDLDIYFLPLDNKQVPDSDKLIMWLEELWGMSESLWQDYDDLADAGQLDANEGISIDVETPRSQPTGVTIEQIERSTSSFWSNQSLSGNFNLGWNSYSGTNEITPKEAEKPKYVSPYNYKLKFLRGGEDRIDVFIL